MMDLNKIYQGDCREVLKTFPDNFIDCCVTSPPYFGLRDYGHSYQIGLEETPELYVSKIVEVFREVKRVLKKEGTVWLNLGDSYAANRSYQVRQTVQGEYDVNCERYGGKGSKVPAGLKSKDLIGIPWMVAFALRADGWYLRSDIIWAKKNCMPESVTDRPTRSHEYIFLLSKSRKYYYDHLAIQERALYDIDGTGTASRKARQSETNKSMPDEMRSGIRPAGFRDARLMNGKNGKQESYERRDKKNLNNNWNDSLSFKRSHKHQIPIPGQSTVSHREERNDMELTGMRNKRDVWFIPTAQFPEAHFAVFNEKLIEPCILAGCPEDGVVLDPFIGSGTTGVVAKKLNRHFIGCELNQEYIKIAEKRLYQTTGLFT